MHAQMKQLMRVQNENYHNECNLRKITNELKRLQVDIRNEFVACICLTMRTCLS